jgi:AcrR family transcriptional regulator
MAASEETLRERTRRAVRGEIAGAALELFLARGFEATTVEEIAHAAGISRRSYFRYFASKDEALSEGLASVGAAIAEALLERPDTESAWLALRRSFDTLTRQTDGDPRARALGRLMLERPGLQYDKSTAWSDAIAQALVARAARGAVGAPGARSARSPATSAIEAESLAASAMACLHVAQRRWLATGEGATLGSLLDEGMAAVHPLG